MRIVSFPLNAYAFGEKVPGIDIFVNEVDVVIKSETSGGIQVVLEDLQMSGPLLLHFKQVCRQCL